MGACARATHARTHAPTHSRIHTGFDPCDLLSRRHPDHDDEHEPQPRRRMAEHGVPTHCLVLLFVQYRVSDILDRGLGLCLVLRQPHKHMQGLAVQGPRRSRWAGIACPTRAYLLHARVGADADAGAHSHARAHTRTHKRTQMLAHTPRSLHHRTATDANACARPLTRLVLSVFAHEPSGGLGHDARREDQHHTLGQFRGSGWGCVGRARIMTVGPEHSE